MIGSIFHTSSELLKRRISQSPVLLIVVLVQTVPWPDSTRCRRAGEIVPEALSSIEEIPDKNSTHK